MLAIIILRYLNVRNLLKSLIYLTFVRLSAAISCPHGAACDDYSSRASDSILCHESLVNLTYQDSAGKLQEEMIKEGYYGITSRLSNESGVIVHLRLTTLGERTRCTIYNLGVLEKVRGEDWVALMDRGSCRGEGLQEILGVVREAVAIVWYTEVKIDSVGRLLYEMNSNRKNYKDDAVVVYIPQSSGERLAKLVDNGTRVYMSLSQGRVKVIKFPDGVNTTSMLFLSISFIVLMIISMAWLIFYYIQRSRHTYAKQRLSRKMMSAAKKALTHMPLRTFRGDEEPMEPGFDLCVVCIEGYRSSDVARVLPCKHVFHKQCIDPWLLQQRNCPICKADILKAYGLQVCRSRGSGSVPQAAASSTIDPDLVSGVSYNYSDGAGAQESSRDFDSEGVEIVHFQQLAHIEHHNVRDVPEMCPLTSASSEEGSSVGEDGSCGRGDGRRARGRGLSAESSMEDVYGGGRVGFSGAGCSRNVAKVHPHTQSQESIGSDGSSRSSGSSAARCSNDFDSVSLSAFGPQPSTENPIRFAAKFIPRR